MNTSSFYLFATKDEVVNALTPILAEDGLYAVMHYWPPHSEKLTSSHELGEDILAENACNVYIAFAPIDIDEFRQRHDPSVGNVRVDLPRFNDGALEEMGVRGLTSAYCEESNMVLPQPDVKELFKKVSKPFRKLRKYPVYDARGKRDSSSGCSEGAREWALRGGKLTDLVKNLYTLEPCDPSEATSDQSSSEERGQGGGWKILDVGDR